MKKLFVVLILTTLIISWNTGYAAFATQVNEDRVHIDSITNTLDHDVHVIFPRQSYKQLTITQGQSVHANDLPENIGIPSKGALFEQPHHQPRVFCSDKYPEIFFKTPQGSFMLFIGILHQKMGSGIYQDTFQTGIWAMEIKDAAYHDYYGFTCKVIRLMLLATSCREGAYALTIDERKLPPYKNKPEWIEEINLIPCTPASRMSQSFSFPSPTNEKPKLQRPLSSTLP